MKTAFRNPVLKAVFHIHQSHIQDDAVGKGIKEIYRTISYFALSAQNKKPRDTDKCPNHAVYLVRPTGVEPAAFRVGV